MISWRIGLLALVSLHISTALADISGTPRVIDGDTLEINGQRIRLHGIDAPETRQTCKRENVDWLCGQEASKALREYLGEDNALTCEQVDTDRYGRIVARCFKADGSDIGAWMVSNGWALAYRQYSNDYVGFESEAQAENLGLWMGEFGKPWNWRRDQ